MSGQDMRKLMEMTLGQRYIYVVLVDGKPAMASLEERIANEFLEAYDADEIGLTIHKVDLY